MSQKRKELDEPHYCAYCGKELVRKYINGRLEEFASFKKRKYCDKVCSDNGFSMKYSTDEFEREYRAAHHTSRNLAKRFLDKSHCELCGSTKNLDVHHKDENYSNNNLSNLQILCRSCHIKIHRSNYCIICGDKHKGYGYCDKHYQRYIKFNCPFFSKFYTPQECKQCDRTDEKVQECLNKYLKENKTDDKRGNDAVFGNS